MEFVGGADADSATAGRATTVCTVGVYVDIDKNYAKLNQTRNGVAAPHQTHT